MKEPTLLQEYREKLKSKKGSALLLSLLFSVTSIIIASVILNAAVTSSRRVEKTAESSQPYYLVSSLFSVFEYEASSPKKSVNPPVDPDGGMEFTAELSYIYDEKKNQEKNLEDNLTANDPFKTDPNAPETGLETELGDKTNLDSLKKYAAFCLSGAMLSGSEVSRNFVVTTGGSGYDGGDTCAEYQIYCTMKVNPTDYSVQITVTDIKDESNKSLGLPEVRTLVLPTERIEFLEFCIIDEKKYPVRAVFHYQKAKYLSEQDIK